MQWLTWRWGRGRNLALGLGWLLLMLLLLWVVAHLLLLLLPSIGDSLLSVLHVAHWGLLAIAIRLELAISIAVLLSHLLKMLRYLKWRRKAVLNTSSVQLMHTLQ